MLLANFRLEKPIIGCTTILILFSIYFYTCAFIDHYHTKQHVPYHNQHDETYFQRKYLDQTLSPEEHIFRDARIIHYHWVVTKGLKTPDGVWRNVYLINGQFPGPTIEARSRDTLRIHVTNGLENDEGLSLHWHGLRITNEMDGAVGISQCLIPPGSNLTYEILIDDHQAGTFWYHSSSSEQTAEGLYGGLVVHQPAEVKNEMDAYSYDKEILLMIGDWYHRPMAELLEGYLSHASNGAEPMPDNFLINGHGVFKCATASLSHPVNCTDTLDDRWPQLRIQKEKIYRVRVVNVGSLKGITLTLTNANMTAIQVDGGGRIKPLQNMHSIEVLYPGERVDFLVDWNSLERESETSLVVTVDKEYHQVQNLALIHTQSFPILFSPETASNPITIPARESTLATHFSLPTAEGLNPLADLFPPNPDQTFLLYSTLILDSFNHNIPTGSINKTSWKPQSTPLLALDRSQWDEHQLVPWTVSSAKWIDVVVNNEDDHGHPFHLHGFNFWVLSTFHPGAGLGATYNPFFKDASPEGHKNFGYPVRKDTVYIPGRGYVVLRFRADKEGIWMFHCHILWHKAGGMAMAFQVLGDEKGVFRGDIKMRKTAMNFCEK